MPFPIDKLGNSYTKSPCYECTKRRPTCHIDCEDYKSFAEQYKKAKTELWERERGGLMADSLKNERINTWNKRGSWK